MTSYQKEGIREWIEAYRDRIYLAVHGACVGSDDEFHHIVREICGSDVRIWEYPSDIFRLVVTHKDSNHTAPISSGLERNKDIVDTGYHILLAAPQEMEEELRSGTWATVRYARTEEVPVKVFWPKPGGTEEEIVLVSESKKKKKIKKKVKKKGKFLQKGLFD